jgi:D-sedoheptulose 7-phosphate isomerase
MKPHQPKALSHFSNLFTLTTRAKVTRGNGKDLLLDEGFRQAVKMTRAAKGKIIAIGNGGSAAIAGHVQVDLSHSARLKAMTFYDTPQVTAISNDRGYEFVFDEPMKLWAGKGDLLIAISSSGKSKNIIRAAKTARQKGCSIITFTGFSPDNPLRRMGDLNFYVNSKIYGDVEASHSSLLHYLTDCVMVARKK